MFTTRPEISGTFGVAAATHWLAAQTAMGVLERGGNAFDAAVAVSYQGLEGGEASVASMRDFMRGYQRANPLQERELRLVPLLAAVRCAMTLCITEQRAQWFPENRTYILRNHAVATAGLRALMAHGLDVL